MCAVKTVQRPPQAKKGVPDSTTFVGSSENSAQMTVFIVLEVPREVFVKMH